MAHTLSDPARSTKWNLDTTVTQSPSPPGVAGSAVSRSAWWKPRELGGLRLLPWILDLFIAEPKLGVPGLPKVGEETLFEEPAIMDPGRASRDGDRPGPPGGSGEDDRGGGRGFEPTYFF